MRRAPACLATDERGFALVFALGVLIVTSVMIVSITSYTSANARQASYSSRTQVTYALAEAGINNALAVLHKSFVPMTATLLPSTTASLSGGTVTYSGTLSGTTWTITSTGTAANPTGGGSVNRTLTRAVSVYGLNSGANSSAWSRIYADNTSACFTIPTGVSIPSPIATRGKLCLDGTASITGSTTKVAVGDTVTIQANATMGTSGTPIARADIAGTCKYISNPANTPCTSADRVYASTITTSPTDLLKPVVDFAYWYDNAKPGPKYPCTTTSGSPPVFDSNTTYDGSNNERELTPENADYVCQRWESGVLVGELSWTRSTRVLTIKGTIFFDGPADFRDDDLVVHYQGRATIFIAKGWHNDEAICAGGSGAASNCRTTGMASWDPTQNMMVLITGGMNNPGAKDVTFHKDLSAFQGVIWAKNDCEIKDVAYSSGPIICDKVLVSNTPRFFTYPPLGSLIPGQTVGSTSTSTDFMLSVGGQSG